MCSGIPRARQRDARACLSQHDQRELHVEQGALPTEGDEKLTIPSVHHASANVHTVAHKGVGQNGQTASLAVSAWMEVDVVPRI